MVNLKCFKCGKNVPGSLDGLVRHFHRVHALSLNGKFGRQGFICAQNGCQRTFAHCKSFRRHIRNVHLAPNVGDDHNAHRDGIERMEILDEMGDGIDILGGNQVGLNVEGRDNGQVVQGLEDYHQGIEGIVSPTRSLRVSVVRNVCELQSRGVVTSTVISDVTESAKEVFDVTTSYVKERVELFLKTKKIENDPDAQELLKDLDISNPYENLASLDDRINVLKEEFHYIEPREVLLGTRLENRYDSKIGKFHIVSVPETFQYVPFLEVLKLILSNKEARDYIHNEKFSSNRQKRDSYADGTHFRSHPVFSTSIFGIRLIIYYDEIEIVNPLGAKAGVHKIGCFYFIVENLPEHVNSKLSSIHVLILCYDQDVKKYGFEKILKPFLDDLKLLEEGFPFVVDGKAYTITGSIAAVIGDSLAIHLLFGLLSNSAKLFCRACLISRDDLHKGKFEAGQPRTKEIHDAQLARIAERPNDSEPRTESGVSHDSVLHSASNFHVTRNKLFDIMHDILLGVGPWEVKLLLHHYICVLKLLSVKTFNGRVKFFKYGFLESKNRPQANLTRAALVNQTDHTLKQSAAEMWLLLRALPFILKDKVPEDRRHMDLIIYLLRIMEICFAPRLETSILPYLGMLITEHHQLFLELYPEHHLINKHHHMVHYAQCIVEFGPLLKMWCMRCEGKHQELKKYAHIVCNFKNPPKTLIRVPQAVQAAEWGEGNYKFNSLKCHEGETVLVSQTVSASLLKDQLNLNDLDQIFKSTSVTVNGALYKKNFFVCVNSTQPDNDLPLFGKIQEILCVNNLVFLFVRLEKTELLDTSLNAFLISDGKAFSLVEVSKLADYRAINSWVIGKEKESYISMRHIVI